MMEDINIIRELIENGKYDSLWHHKNPFGDEEWIIVGVGKNRRYRNSKELNYFFVDIYTKNVGTEWIGSKGEKSFGNGYLYHTSRTVSIKDFKLLKRRKKLNKIISTL